MGDSKKLESKISRASGLFIGSLRNEISGDPTVITRAYEEFEKIFGTDCSNYPFKDTDTFPDFQIKGKYALLESAAKSVEAGKSDYDPMEIALAIYILRTVQIEKDQVKKADN